MAVNELFDEWTTYEKVVVGDYMHHRRYFGAVSVFLDSRFERPLRILDLGCGDATPVLPSSTTLPSIATPASTRLHRRSSLLAPISPVTPSMRRSWIARWRRSRTASPVRSTSYWRASRSDHLPESNKQKMLQSCLSLLAPDGIVAIIDVFRDGTETREQWLDRWEADARERFDALEPDEIERLVGHVRENDLPESVVGLGQIAYAAGFANAECLAMGPERLNGALVLEGTREAT
ncbi:MAG: hypothetical protein U5O39_18700 [Gammaproteobacteria bacterium]|nr:hypothetical protein [Gammaproteobacteria bacterium]